MPEFLTPPKEVLAAPVTGTAVNHPAQYGGADNPFETIKVLENRLSPVEFAGYCRGNVYAFNDRASSTGLLLDLEKAHWYQARLIAFAKEHGQDAIFPPQFFWSNDGAIYNDDHDLVSGSPFYEVITVHSNLAPHTRWAVLFNTSEDGDADYRWFRSADDAQAFVDDATKPARKKPSRRGQVDNVVLLTREEHQRKHRLTGRQRRTSNKRN